MAKLKRAGFNEKYTSEILEKLTKEKYISGFLQAVQNGELESLGAHFMVYLCGGLVMPLNLVGISIKSRADVDAWEKTIIAKIKIATAITYEFYRGLVSFPKPLPKWKITNPEHNAQKSVKVVGDKIAEERFIAQSNETVYNGELDSAGIDMVWSLETALWFVFQVKAGNCSHGRRTRIEKLHTKKHPLIKFVLFVPWKNQHHLRLIERKAKAALSDQVIQTYSSYHKKQEPPH